MIAIVLLMQATPTATLPLPVDCNDAAHRAYDFFIGEWDVRATGSDAIIAHSRIEKMLGGCAIHETFDQKVGPGGSQTDYHGRSYTSLNLRKGEWQQFYVDSNGTAANLWGGVENGAMVLTSPPGAVMNRMTVAPQPDGSVRQFGVTSTDGGKTWSAKGYDFTYRRRADPPGG